MSREIFARGTLRGRSATPGAGGTASGSSSARSSLGMGSGLWREGSGPLTTHCQGVEHRAW
eukprot:8702436-Lingulodinium_polyedra.AAC.1